MDDVVEFIELVKSLDANVGHACLHGSCYKLHLVIASAFPDAVPYMNRERDHVVTRIGDSFYDVTGRVGSTHGKAALRYHEMDAKEVAVAGKWGSVGSSHSRSASVKRGIGYGM